MFGAQGGNFDSATLSYSALGSPGYDCYRQHYDSVLYQTGRDVFPFPITSSSTTISVASVSEHSNQGQIQCRLCQYNSDHLSRPNHPLSTEWCLHLEIVVPSACMEAVMQHFQAAGFSEEVSSSQQLLDDPQHMTGGFASLSGPGNKVLIHLVPELLR